MNRAYKFRIYPTKAQETVLAKTFGSVRFIYNKLLSDNISHYEQTKTKLKRTPAFYKVEFPWLKEVNSLALANSALNFETAMKNFFKNKNVCFPKFKSRHKNNFSYTTNNQKGSIRFENQKLKLPKVGFIKVIQHRKIPENFTLKSATISKTPSGKYFVSILFDYNFDAPKIEIKKFLGLDFSMKELFIDSSGFFANYPKFYRQSLVKLARFQRILSKSKIGSKNREKLRLKLNKIHEKISNQRKDFLHKISTKLAKNFDCIAIEDLNMKGLSQALNFGKSVMDNGFGKFVELLKYKLEELGKVLIKIDKFFPSSKMCSNCGSVKSELLLKERVYSCKSCNFICDRDLNAAINIKNEGRRILQKP